MHNYVNVYRQIINICFSKVYNNIKFMPFPLRAELWPSLISSLHTSMLIVALPACLSYSGYLLLLGEFFLNFISRLT